MDSPSSRSAAGGGPVYRVYGIAFASDYPFQTPLPRADAPPEFRFFRSEAALAVPAAATRLYTSRRLTAEGHPALTIDREETSEYFRLPDGTCFRVAPSEIAVYAPEPARAATAELCFLGTLLTYLLERRGVPVLHAAAVSADGAAAAFLAGNGGGKSSLAAGCLDAGFALVSDDLLPIREVAGIYSAVSGYPQMRFWPAEARHFGGSERALARVHPDLEKRRLPVGSGGFGEFKPGGAPLGAIYIPERQHPAAPAAPIEIFDLGAREAVVSLSRELFLQALLQDLGLMGERLRLLATLVRNVPIRRLRYPSGLEHLPRVSAAIREDLASRR